MRALASAAAGVAALALASCGGNDKQEAQQVVRDVAKATTARDGKKLCGELLSRDFLERSTGAKGDKAEQQCVSQVDQLRNGGFKLVKIGQTKLDGDRATVTAEIESQGQKRPQVFSLKKEDGSFRLTTGAGP